MTEREELEDLDLARRGALLEDRGAGRHRDYLGHRRSAGGQGLEPLGMLAVASQDLVTLGCIHRR